MDIVLIAPPWPLFNRPSIQLGVLKAYLTKNLPKGVRVQNLHPYLHVAAATGFSTYHAISQSGWASEAVFSHILFPDKSGPGTLFDASLHKGTSKKTRIDFDRICRSSQAALEKAIDACDFTKTHIVGISVCLNQLTAGLFVAKLLKQRYPDLPIVMGGASVSGDVGIGILRSFPWIDYVIDGEGEIPLLELSKYTLGLSSAIASKAVIQKGQILPGHKEQISDMDKLPVPDFDDYFRELSQVGGGGINVVLPVEASRGCWWGQCSFCNLNLQWKGYRAKRPEKVAKEIDFLSTRYSVIDFAFMDNCLPRKDVKKIFGLLASQGRDYSIFGEIRASHSRQELKIMKEGGLDSLQIGIEALSTSLLKRLKKGATAISNLYLMKSCAEIGIDLQSNMIICFPKSSKAEVEETLKNLDYAWPFPTLKPVRFWLGMASPIYDGYRTYGIRCIRASRKYSYLFPSKIMNSLTPLILDYVGDRGRQAVLWRPVETKLNFFRRKRKELGIKGSGLTYRDGGHFVIIRQLLPDGQVLTHRLAELSRQLYLAAEEPVPMDKIFAKAPHVPKDKVEQFIGQMVKKKLMFKENSMVLSLACRQKTKRSFS